MFRTEELALGGAEEIGAVEVTVVLLGDIVELMTQRVGEPGALAEFHDLLTKGQLVLRVEAFWRVLLRLSGVGVVAECNERGLNWHFGPDLALYLHRHGLEKGELCQWSDRGQRGDWCVGSHGARGDNSDDDDDGADEMTAVTR